MAQQYLAQARDFGFYIYTGLPNGTEVGQEMDQLFALLKKLVYENRDKLYKARLRVDGPSAKLTLNDIGHIHFGTPVTLKNGEIVELAPAFYEAFETSKILDAMKKCGYCPATRAALSSDRIRHEVIETLDGEADVDADPLAQLYDAIEADNTSAADALDDEGYDTKTFRAKIKHVTAAQIEGRDRVRTEPYTRARQVALESVSTSGGHFSVTNGGGCVNSTDQMYAFERKRMKEQADKNAKRKEKCEEFEPNGAKAATFMASAQFKEAPMQWSNENLKTMIREAIDARSANTIACCCVSHLSSLRLLYQIP